MFAINSETSHKNLEASQCFKNDPQLPINPHVKLRRNNVKCVLLNIFRLSSTAPQNYNLEFN